MNESVDRTVLPDGKLPPEVLEQEILPYGGAIRSEVILGPRVGEDAAVIDWPDGSFMVVTSDPIVGASRGAGRLLVTVNANDVASKGGDPAYLVTTLIFPTGTARETIRDTMREISEACLEAGVAVVGGHTEVNEKYRYPVLSGTMIGMAKRVLSAADISAGDLLLMTKHAGIEGMSILAADRVKAMSSVFTPGEIREIASWSRDVSVLPESRVLRQWARFMHDPTEGGLAGGISEISLLSGLGVDMDRDLVNVDPLTMRCAKRFGFDPMHFISSGVLLAVLPPDVVKEALRQLSDMDVQASVIGTMVKGCGNMPRSNDEELWKVLQSTEEGEK